MSIFKDIEDPLASKLRIHPVVLYVILLVISALTPAVFYYGDLVYKKDVAEYEVQKLIHECADDSRLERVGDNLYRYRMESERPGVDIPYTGHSRDFIIEPGWTWAIFLLSFIAFSYLVIIAVFLLMLLVLNSIWWVYDRFFNKDKW